MNPYEIYKLVICIIIYVLLLTIGVFVIVTIFKLSLKLIKNGAEDKAILNEYEKNKDKKKGHVLDRAFSVLLCLILAAIFAFSNYISCTTNRYFNNTPTFKVVMSSSMATKNEKNTYLFENNINNQFNTFDLILTYKVPKEEDIKLYDIILYEVDGYLVIHRVVKIEEKNERHPNERWFTLQGDAVSQPDRFPVKYSQMRGIYRSERVPFIGSFIDFMQSPAGYIAIILVALAIIFTPILDGKLGKARRLRLEILLASNNAETDKKELDNNTTDTQNTNVNATQEEIGVTQQEKTFLFNFKGKVNEKTFDEKLEEFPICKERYLDIVSLLSSVKRIRVIASKKTRIFKSGNTCIVKFAIRGKTLNAYIALNTAEYENSKYIYVDESLTKKHVNYPMRVKVTSARQVKWVKELISQILDGGNK